MEIGECLTPIPGGLGRYNQNEGSQSSVIPFLVGLPLFGLQIYERHV